MKNDRTLTIIGGILLAAAAALAQVTPAPPAPPAPAAKPAPVPQPAQIAVEAPRADFQDLQQKLMDKAAEAVDKAQAKLAGTDWQDVQQKAMDQAAEAFEKAQTKLAGKADWQDMEQNALDAAAKAQDKMLDLQFKLQDLTSEKLSQQWTVAGDLANAKLADMQFNFNMNMPKFLAQQNRTLNFSSRGSDESVYRNGQNAIDSHHYDQALEAFNTVISRGGARIEGALYWKAYSLNKLGRRDEAQAAIDQLRKSYPNSKWLDDAKALEVEVKASKGTPVSPEAETDEEIKIFALNGLMQSDPERAIPQVENMLKTSHSPKLKRQAVTVLGMNSSPRARQDLEQVARTGNPDLQVAAINYLSGRRNDTGNPQLFSEIYAASNDRSVKSVILNSFASTNDKDRLMQIAKTEKDKDLRDQAINALGNVDGQPELWQLYQNETTPDGKIDIIHQMHRNGNAIKLAEAARTDKDPKVRMAAIQAIASQRGGDPSAALTAVYAAEQDPQVKRQIVSQLAGARNGKALVDICRTEKDTNVKLQIVEQLARMTKYSKEATDYLQEILSK